MAVIFRTEKDVLKKAIKEAVVNYCDMLDCLDSAEQLGLKFEVISLGFKIKIEAEAE